MTATIRATRPKQQALVRPRGELKALLVHAAARRVERGGRASVSMRRLAQDLAARGRAVTHTAMLFHFGSLEALLAEVAACWWQECAEEVEREAARVTRAGKRLESIAMTYLSFAIAHPQRFRLMYDAALWARPVGTHASRDAERELESGRNRVFASIVDAVAEAKATNQLAASVATQDAARLVASLAQGLASEFVDEGLGRRQADDAESTRKRQRAHARSLVRLLLGRLA